MKKIFMLSIIALLLISSISCSVREFNEMMNPGKEIDVQVYQITLPEFTGREAIYCKEYIKDGDDIVLYEWWKDNGATVWNPSKNNGLFRISSSYSIKTVIAPSLPK